MLFSTTIQSTDCQEARMPVRKKDTARALGLLEDYCTKLRKPEEQQLKTAILRVMDIFKSSLFQALLDIQEFYEVTLLNTQKSCEEKVEEVNNMAEKWERAGSPTVILQHPCPGDELRDLSSSEQNGMEQAENSAAQYRYQDEDSPPQDLGFPRLTNEVRAPELVHVSEKNLSEIENVHGYVSHSHISPLKICVENFFLMRTRGLLVIQRRWRLSWMPRRDAPPEVQTDFPGARFSGDLLALLQACRGQRS